MTPKEFPGHLYPGYAATSKSGGPHHIFVGCVSIDPKKPVRNVYLWCANFLKPE